MDRYLRQKGINLNEVTPLDRLLYISRLSYIILCLPIDIEIMRVHVHSRFSYSLGAG